MTKDEALKLINEHDFLAELLVHSEKFDTYEKFHDSRGIWRSEIYDVAKTAWRGNNGKDITVTFPAKYANEIFTALDEYCSRKGSESNRIFNRAHEIILEKQCDDIDLKLLFSAMQILKKSYEE